MNRSTDMCVVSGPRILNATGQITIVTLVGAVSLDTEYGIQYAASDTVDVPDLGFSAVHKVDGSLLVLTALTTPLILNLPGAYRVVQNSPDGGSIIMLQFRSDKIPRGDIR